MYGGTLFVLEQLGIAGDAWQDFDVGVSLFLEDVLSQ
jgi:hypothetical protein